MKTQKKFCVEYSFNGKQWGGGDLIVAGSWEEAELHLKTLGQIGTIIAESGEVIPGYRDFTVLFDFGVFTLRATSKDEAEERLEAIADTGEIIGVHVADIPMVDEYGNPGIDGYRATEQMKDFANPFKDVYSN